MDCDHRNTDHRGRCKECGERECDHLDLFPLNTPEEVAAGICHEGYTDYPTCHHCWDEIMELVL